jgi:hypothetical protein
MGMVDNMKGQLFLIATIITIMMLFSLAGIFTIFKTGQEKVSLESEITDSKLDNIINEYKNIAGLASIDPDVNGTAIYKLADFAEFIRTDTGAKSLYAFAASNSSDALYSVTVGNYLGERINLTINTTGSTPEIYTINTTEDRSNVTREFSWSTQALVNITLNYTSSSGNTIERFVLNLSSMNATAAFFHVEIETNDIFLVSKETYNRSW